MDSMKIIGLHGLARSGKDTLASYLVEHHGFVRIGLADPLRKFVSDITGIPLEDLMDGPTKETPLEWLNNKSPRVLMQTLGTEWGRELIGPGDVAQGGAPGYPPCPPRRRTWRGHPGHPVRQRGMVREGMRRRSVQGGPRLCGACERSCSPKPVSTRVSSLELWTTTAP